MFAWCVNSDKKITSWSTSKSFLDFIQAFLNRQTEIVDLYKKQHKAEKAQEISEIFLSRKPLAQKIKLSETLQFDDPDMEHNFNINMPFFNIAYMSIWPILHYVNKQLSKLSEPLPPAIGSLILARILYSSEYAKKLKKECDLDLKKKYEKFEDLSKTKHKLSKTEQALADILYEMCVFYKHYCDAWEKTFDMVLKYNDMVSNVLKLIDMCCDVYKIKDLKKKYKTSPYMSMENVLLNFENILSQTFLFGHKTHSFRYLLNTCMGGATHKYTKMDSAKDLLKTLYNKYKDENISADYVFSKMFIEYNQPDYLLWTLDSIPQDDTIKKWIKKWDKENGINRKGFKRKAKGKHS